MCTRCQKRILVRLHSARTLAIVFALVISQTIGCYSYYVYRYEPSHFDLDEWRVSVSSAFCENGSTISSMPVARSEDSLSTKWSVSCRAKYRGDGRPTTTIYVDSIAVFHGASDSGVVVSDPLSSERYLTVDKRMVGYLFGLFVVREPVSMPVFVDVYVRLVDMSSGRLIKESHIRTQGTLGKETHVWTGD